MFTKSRTVVSVLSILFVSMASVWATPIEGIVKDARGKVLPGAQVRIQTQEGKTVATVTTDVKGHYLSANLPAAVYKVDLLVGGIQKASIKNVSADGAKNAQMNFELRAENPAVKTMTKNGKHFVWMPAETGSHIGGRWVEVNEDGTSTAGEHMDTGDGRTLQRMQSKGTNTGQGP